MKYLLALFYFLIVVIFDIRLISTFEAPKWTVFYFFIALSTCCFIFTKKKFFKIPLLKKRSIIFLLIFVTWYLLSMFSNWPGNYLSDIIDWTAFLTGVFFIYNWSVDAKEKDYRPLLHFNALATFILISITFLVVLNINPTFVKGWKIFWSQYSLFGNANNSAEFLGFSIGLQILSLKILKDKYHLRKSLLIYSLIIFTFFHSRSLSIALAISMMVYIPDIRKYWKTISIGGVLIVFFTTTLVYISQGDNQKDVSKKSGIITLSDLLSTKKGNTKSRYNMLINTLYMIKDNPMLGFGPAKFIFAYVPYLKRARQDFIVRENRIARSPHNSYLEATVESGIPFGIMVIVLLFYLLKNILFDKKLTKDPFKMWITSSSIFFIIDGLFNFPLEIPFPFMSITMILGIGLAKNTEFKTIDRNKCVKLFTIILFIIMSSQTYRYYFSHYVLYKYPFNHKKLSKACLIYPRNWKTCIHKAEFEIKLEEYNLAQNTIIKELKVNPFNIAALRALSLLYIYTGKKQEGCQLAEMYINFFEKETSLNKVKNDHCENL